MNKNELQWMNYSINIADQSSDSGLRVGSVLVSDHNELLCSAYMGEKCDVSWCTVLLDKVQKLRIFSAHSIYITINTLSEKCSFDLIDCLNKICIDNIYLGLPDPALASYLVDDPIIRFKYVYRYPDELQRSILEQNREYFINCKQNIRYSSFYFENRISNLIKKKLSKQGFIVSDDEFNANKNRCSLSTVICNKYGMDYATANGIVTNVIAEAFNDKYSSYNYLMDTRTLDSKWRSYFLSVYRRLSNCELSENNILNVGVGGGYEAIALFSECSHITFVDIAQDGLKEIKEKIPLSKIFMASADDLSMLPDNSYDLYVSLRTYNSSFFDVQKALGEAYRVLKTNAIIVISVANGFLNLETRRIIPGLIVPGTDFVDIYRGMDLVKIIQMCLFQLKFKNIEILPTSTEIFLSASVS